MPGPVSDSFDPEFGTSDNADLVRTAIRGVRDRVCVGLPEERRDIVAIAVEGPAPKGGGRRNRLVNLSMNERRVLRFALDRALESI